MTDTEVVSPSPANTPNGRSSFVYDVFQQWGAFLGVVVGVGIGFWAAYEHSVRIREGVVLTSDVGAAIGLLAVSLAAMTIVLAFLDGIYKNVIRKKGGVDAFFRPFKLVAVLSGAAAIAGIVSSLQSNTRPFDLSDAVFGLSVGLLVWAIVQSVQLVFVLAAHGVAWFNLDRALSRGVVEAVDETARQRVAGTSSTLKSSGMKEAARDQPPDESPTAR
jgi:hypothetical protein